jgi:taurine dioxygenase
MSASQHLSATRIAGALGAAVGGVQLARLEESAFAETQAAFLKHQVLFFSGQELTREQQRAFARRFGTLNIHAFHQPLRDEGYPEFVVFQGDQQYPYVAQAWHAAVTYLPEPPLGSVLRCVVAPPLGGDTMWVSVYAA